MARYYLEAHNKANKEIVYASNNLWSLVSYLRNNDGLFIDLKIYEIKEVKEISLDEVGSRLKKFWKIAKTKSI